MESNVNQQIAEHLQQIAHLFSKNNDLWRSRAKAKGYKLNQKGLFKGAKLIAGATEEEIFKVLNEQYLEPNQRA